MPAPILSSVTHACFGLSYLAAFGLEVARYRRPGNRWFYPVGLAFGAAGLVAHTLYLAYNRVSPAEPYAALLLLAFVLAVFYLYGAVHHARQAWAVFVLPVVLGLVGVSFGLYAGGASANPGLPDWFTGPRAWAALHGFLLLFAAVGISVALIASVMYLVQARRVRTKANPLGGVSLLNLERLEAMNRRGVNAAFPLLLAGVTLGQLLRTASGGAVPADSALPPLKVLGSYGLAAVVGVLIYLRYGTRAAGRRLAFGTIFAFALLVAVLVASHPFAEGAK